MLTKSISSVKHQLRQLTPYSRTLFSGGKNSYQTRRRKMLTIYPII